MGNPITYRVTAEQEPAGKAVTFHRVKLKVSVMMSGRRKDYELSTPAKSYETVEFDISSCFRAAADSYEFTPLSSGTVNFPEFAAVVEARDVWLEDGELIDPAPLNAGKPNTSCSAYMGAFSDFERLSTLQLASGTRKPQTPEIAFAGDTVVYAMNHSSTAMTLSASDLGRVVSLPNGRSLYVDSPRRGSHVFQMITSRGTLESIRAFQLEAEKVKGSTEEHVISRLERFDQFSRIYAKRTADRTELMLSSGFVSYEWARWWAYEFCASPRHWMLVDKVWVPCIVVRDDGLTVIDESKGGMCYVSFECKLNLNGTVW